MREKKEEYLKQDSFYPKNRESKIRKNEEYLIERKRKRRKRLEKGDRKILNFKSTLYNGSGSPLVTTVGGFNLNHLITVRSTDNQKAHTLNAIQWFRSVIASAVTSPDLFPFIIQLLYKLT